MKSSVAMARVWTYPGGGRQKGRLHGHRVLCAAFAAGPLPGGWSLPTPVSKQHLTVKWVPQSTTQLFPLAIVCWFATVVW